MRCSGGLAGAVPQPCTAVDLPPGRHAAQLAAQLLGSTDDERLELVDGSNPAAGGVPSGGQQHPQRFAVAAAARQRLVLVAKGLPSRTDRIDRVGLGAGRAGGALGPGDLHDPLAVGVQKCGQPGAVAAGALDRPAAPRRVAGDLRAGELQELLVAGGVGPGRGLGEDPTDRAEGGSRQGVTVGVDADDAVDGVCQDGHAVAPSGGGRGRCRPGRSHRAAQL
jgi:hypothetical protein